MALRESAQELLYRFPSVLRRSLFGRCAIGKTLIRSIGTMGWYMPRFDVKNKNPVLANATGTGPLKGDTTASVLVVEFTGRESKRNRSIRKFFDMKFTT
jgi:hypothetical protein